LLLLAATPIGLGCIIVSDDTADTTGVETGNLTSGQTTTSGGTGTDTTPVTSDGTGTSGSSSESSESGSSGADSTGADSTGGGGAEVCPAYADHAVKCMLPYSEYTLDSCIYQQMSVETYYPECAVLWEEYIACLSGLSCEELMGVERCPDQEGALIAMACPTIE
jgi:hypothetical protein